MIKYVDINENLIRNKEKNYVESNWKDLMDFFIIDNPFVLASEYHFNCKYSEDFIINREYGTILYSPIKGLNRGRISMGIF